MRNKVFPIIALTFLLIGLCGAAFTQTGSVSDDVPYAQNAPPVYISDSGFDFSTPIMYVSDVSAIDPAFAPVTVTGVHDGDNLTVIFAGTTEKRTVRLARIDAPEIAGLHIFKTQPGALQSAAYLRSLALNKTLYLDTITPPQSDPYGRLIADAYLPDSQNVQLKIVESGWAWSTAKGKDNLSQAIKDAEKTARKNDAGIFGLPEKRVTPWTWKKRYSRN